MIAGLTILLSIAATVDPLPKELEYRLSLAREIPAPYSAAVIVALVPSAKLSPAQTAALAEEAFNIAIGKDQAIAVKAWTLYRDNYDKTTGRPLAFPLRDRTVPATCENTEIDDPKAYYRNAIEAGPTEFSQSMSTVRSAVEVARAVEAIVATTAAEQARLAPLGTRYLAAATGSDREFVYAMRYTSLHRSVLKLAETNSRNNVLASYRNFLIANWKAVRCAGNRADEFIGVINEFNKVARSSGVPKLDLDAANVVNVDTTTKALPITEHQLNYKVTHAPVDEISVRGMLHEIEQFQPLEVPDPLATMRARNELFRSFAERLKGNPWEDQVMREWLQFVVRSSLKTYDLPQWFASVRALAGWAAKNASKQSVLIGAGDSGLTAYVRLVTLLPESEVTRVLP